MVFKFDLDRYTHKQVPGPLSNKSHPKIARWFGNHVPKRSIEQIPDYILWLDIFIGSFCAIIVIESVFVNDNSPIFAKHHAPIIIASYGASAILVFNATPAPLSQPRNVFVGHFLSSLIGICIQKLFSLSQGGVKHYWVGGALSVGISSVLMSIFNCVHPPAGASALLPLIDEQIREMSWWYLPVQIISSALIITVGLITNNVLRRYPMHWWVPNKPVARPVAKPEPKPSQIEEKLIEPETTVTNSDSNNNNLRIEITTNSLSVPDFIDLTEDQHNALQQLQKQLSAGLQP